MIRPVCKRQDHVSPVHRIKIPFNYLYIILYWNNFYKIFTKKRSRLNSFIYCRRGNCKSVTMGLDCEVGLRRRTYNVVAGSVLSVWTRVENVLAAKHGHGPKLQVVRLKTTDGHKIVGKYWRNFSPMACEQSHFTAIPLRYYFGKVTWSIVLLTQIMAPLLFLIESLEFLYAEGVPLSVSFGFQVRPQPVG